MYSTCLHCLKDLGTNDQIEHFQIGARLAFDSAKGRLWVVCPHCSRWNLTPIEERWEAVEECERHFRAQRVRAQTDNVGLAKLRDDTELIRIGEPLRPEFAAWRYGGVFRDRLRRRLTLGTGIGAAAIASGLMVLGVPTISSLTPIVLMPIAQLMPLGIALNRKMFATKVRGDDGKILRVTRADLDHTQLSVDGDVYLLRLRHSYGTQELSGDLARRALARLLSRVNSAGASTGRIREATAFIAAAGDPQHAIEKVARAAEHRTGNFEERVAAVERAPRGRTIAQALAARQQAIDVAFRGATPAEKHDALGGVDHVINRGALYRLPLVERLALEMALHEKSEQFALDAELASLEEAWREAEEIAAIADNLLPVTPYKPFAK